MSETDKDQDLERIEKDSALDDESAEPNKDPDLERTEKDSPLDEETGEFETVPPAAEPAEEKRPKRRGNGVAWLALLVSLIAAAAVGYTIFQSWAAAGDTAAEDAIADLDVRLRAAAESRDELAARVQQLGEVEMVSRAELDALRQSLTEDIERFSSIPPRMSTLESSVASLAGISDGARDAWLLAEAEYYMQIANAQLQLANNPALAALALKMADERVVQMGNPALTDVRRAISDELAALDLMEKPDIAGATMTLASLAHVVESLPLASETKAESAQQASADEESSGVNRAWVSLKNAMSGLVKVTPPDETRIALLSPDAESFLRSNLALQLQSARLALLRGEQVVFEQTLDDTSELLSRYFDNDSAQVASARATLLELRGDVVTSAPPDISGSLRLLRQYQALRENGQ